MLRRHVRLLAILVVAVLVLVAVAFRFRFSPLWPGPALPAGATRLHIATEDAHVVPTFGCPTALLLPGRVATEGDDLVLVSPETNEPVKVVWPSGWAAWRLDGRAELVTRDGVVVGREGEIIDGFGGGTGPGNASGGCFIRDAG